VKNTKYGHTFVDTGSDIAQSRQRKKQIHLKRKKKEKIK
jgi:hypothetical protein